MTIAYGCLVSRYIHANTHTTRCRRKDVFHSAVNVPDARAIRQTPRDERRETILAHLIFVLLARGAALSALSRRH